MHALQEMLGLALPPVGVTFSPTPPEGLDRVPASAAAGCAYWKQAAGGRAFYTEPADHFNCPVGAHTHGLDMPPEAAAGLQELIGTMVSLQYLDPAEIPSIPRIDGGFGAAVYAPVETGSGEPDVVLIRGDARQIMLVAEAASAAGMAAASGSGPLGRPACSVIPEVMRTGRCATSLAASATACIRTCRITSSILRRPAGASRRWWRSWV